MIKSLGWLTFAQGLNFLAPLTVLPIASRALAPEEFGAFIATLAITQIAYIITDYGFFLTGTVALTKTYPSRSSAQSTLSNILSAKAILLPFTLLFALVSLVALPLHKYPSIALWSIPAIVAQCFQLQWFFQGIQCLQKYVIPTLCGKLVYIAIVSIFIREPGDGSILGLAWALGALVGSGLSIREIHRLGYKLTGLSLHSGRAELQQGKSFFASRVASAAFTAAAPLFAGMVSLTEAASYGVADQIYRALQALVAPVNQVIYPMMATTRNWKLFLITTATVSTITIVAYIGLSHYVKEIITLVAGDKYTIAVQPLLTLGLAWVINYLSASFGYPACSGIEKVQIANTTIWLGCAVFLFCIAIISAQSTLSALTIAKAVLTTEASILIMRLSAVGYFSYKNSALR